MSERTEILRQALLQTGTTQTSLARMSGVRQPSISAFLSGRTEFSDDLLDALLACLGFRLEVVRRPLAVDLDRSHRRSWLLHRQLATHLSSDQTLTDWSETIQRNLDRLEHGVHGEPHATNVARWREMVQEQRVRDIRRIMTGLDDDAVAMREVSPLGGLLPQTERELVLAERAS